MASVMNQSIQIDEERYAKEQELMSRLLTENKVTQCKISIKIMLGVISYNMTLPTINKNNKTLTGPSRNA